MNSIVLMSFFIVSALGGKIVVWTYPSGDVYRGEVKNNKRHGYGMHETRYGTYYGQFKSGLRHGNAVFYFRDGTKYEGKFEFGKQNGYGLYQNTYRHYQNGARQRSGCDIVDGQISLASCMNVYEKADKEAEKARIAEQKAKKIAMKALKLSDAGLESNAAPAYFAYYDDDNEDSEDDRDAPNSGETTIKPVYTGGLSSVVAVVIGLAIGIGIAGIIAGVAIFFVMKRMKKQSDLEEGVEPAV